MPTVFPPTFSNGGFGPNGEDLEATYLNSLFAAVKTYIDAGGGGSGSNTVTNLGSVGATSTVTMSGGDKLVTATLTADHVCTITPTAGGIAHFLVAQNATGGWTFTISDGTTLQALPVATAASALSAATVASADGSTLIVVGSRVTTPAQEQRGFWSSPTAYRYRGPWAASTAYVRGEMVTDPLGVLRWCGVSHTSPSTFSAGKEYSSNSPWWGIVTTTGAWRGTYAIQHGTYGTQLSPGDLVIDPNTGQLTRALFVDSAGSSWNATKFGDLGLSSPVSQIDPGVVMPPLGMPGTHAAVQGLGLYPRTSGIRYPSVKPLLRLNTAADFTSVTGGTVDADPDPIDPAGCPRFTFSGSSGTIALVQLPSPIDISNSIVRSQVKVTGHNGAKQIGVLGQSLTTSAAVTKLSLDSSGLWYPLAPWQQVVLNDGAGHTQAFVGNEFIAPSASVQQIPVNSLTPTFAFPSGTTTVNLVDRTTTTYLAFEVSSDNFATHASQIVIDGSSSGVLTTHLAEDAWDWVGGGPGNWSTLTGFANPANLASINAMRWVGVGGSTANVYFSVNRVLVFPNNGASGSRGDGRAKATLTCDDSYVGHWTYLLNAAMEYGFPICTMTAGRIDSSSTELTYDNLRYMSEFANCQAAVHYYYPNDGGDDFTKGGPQRDAYLLRGRHSLKGAGLSGTEVFAWHDDDHPSAATLPIIRKYFKACRGYGSQDDTLQTLPPITPWYMNAYGEATADTTGGTVATTASQLNSGTSYTSIPITGGLTGSPAAGTALVAGETLSLGAQTVTVSTTTVAGGGVTSIPINAYVPSANITAGTAVLNPGSAMKAFVDRAITYKGLCQFAWENVASLKADIPNLLAYLDYQRASIDVVTMDEALQPWTVPV